MAAESLFLVALSCSWIIVIAAAVFIIKTCRKKNSFAPAAAPPPAPGRYGGGWWHLRETAAFLAAHGSARGFYHFVHARYLRHGPCFRTALLGRVHVFLSASTPAACDLLAADPPHFAKRYARTAADLLGKHSILCCSHAQHRLARRAVAALFAMPSTVAFAAAFDRLAADLVMRQWSLQLQSHQSRRPVVVLDAALDISFRAICWMLLGKSSRSMKLMERLQSDVSAVTQAMLALPLRWVPGTLFRRGLQARKRIMAALGEEMAARRGEEDGDGGGGGDFLQAMLVRRQRCHPDALSDEQIRDNILTLIIAGQVTTATAISWMVKYLSDNRQIQDKLRALQLELPLITNTNTNKQKQLQGDDYSSSYDYSPLTLQDLNTMDYAYKVVKESLRMASIVSWFPKVALNDCQIAGFHINKGWIVNVDARSLHYDPAVFHNPTLFDPSRFNEGDDAGAEETRMRAGRRLLVFGAGGRTCLGMNLAKIMMLVFLHRLVTTFRWEMADDDPSLEKWAMFPRLKNGCPIHLTPIHHS